MTIRSAAPLDLSPLNGLDRIAGDLTVGPTLAVTSIGFAGLRQVDGRLAIVSDGATTGVFFPVLESVGALDVRDAPDLTTLSIPSLRRVTGAVRLERVPSLAHVDASALTTVGGELTVVAPALATWLGVAPAVGGARTVTAPVHPGE